MAVIDAKGAVAGRLAAYTAKLALTGQNVTIFNIESAVITGDPKMVESKYSGRREVQNKSNPEHSMKWPRRPDLLFKRIIAGMLPKHSARKKAGLMKIKVYLGTPAGVVADAKVDPKAGHKKITSKFVTLGKLCNQLGWNQ